MCGTTDRLLGITAAEKKAKAKKRALAAEKAQQEATAKRELAEPQELVDAKTAFEQGKTKERVNRLSTQGGGLSTKYKGANLGGMKDELSSNLGG